MKIEASCSCGFQTTVNSAGSAASTLEYILEDRICPDCALPLRIVRDGEVIQEGAPQKNPSTAPDRIVKL